MSTDIKVGDKVRLTGDGWNGRGGFPAKGTIVTIDRIDERGIPRMAAEGKRPDADYGIYNAGIAGYSKDSGMVRDWSGELVVEEAPKFQVGDVVRHFSSTRHYEVIEVRAHDGWLRFKRFETTGYFKPKNYTLISRPNIAAEVGGRVRITIEAKIAGIFEGYTSYDYGNGSLFSDQILASGAKVEVIAAAPAPEPPKPTTAEQMLALKPGQAFKVGGLSYTYVRQEGDSYIAFTPSGALEQGTIAIADTKWGKAHNKVTVIA